MLISSIPDSPWWGFTRAARNETRSNFIFAIEYDTAAVRDATSSLIIARNIFDIINSQTLDREFRLESGQQSNSLRLTNTRFTELDISSIQQVQKSIVDFRLEISVPGVLSSIQWCPVNMEYEKLSAEEVLVEVKATSLNFKDLMLALGALPGMSPIFGMECSGVVKQVPSSSKYRVGDSVICFPKVSGKDGLDRDSLFTTTAIVDNSSIFPIPKNLSFEEAAASMVIYSTALHAIRDRAQAHRAEWILIHSAMGGVGQAALNLARHFDLKIIASAGTEEKRKRLLEAPFSVDFVMNSRDPSKFYQEVMSFTNWKGVDICLNSLAGKGQQESLRCLTRGGRFAEIGKVDALTDNILHQGSLRENISFLSCHLDFLAKSHSEKFSILVRDTWDLLDKGILHPVETTVYPACCVIEALKQMQIGSHCGKLVVNLFHECLALHQPPSDKKWELMPKTIISSEAPPQNLFDGNFTLFVSGGTQGLDFNTLFGPLSMVFAMLSCVLEMLNL